VCEFAHEQKVQFQELGERLEDANYEIGAKKETNYLQKMREREKKRGRKMKEKEILSKKVRQKFLLQQAIRPVVNFINFLRATFTCADPKSAKKDSQVVNLFFTFGICAHKSC